MIHSIYNQVGKVNLAPCSKDRPIINVPLFKINYLNEFQTQLEKEQVRQNLGIKITGDYIYPNKKNPVDTITDITNVNDALDFLITIAQSYQDKNIESNVSQLVKDVKRIDTWLKDDTVGIDAINKQIVNINKSIKSINDQLANLDVDTQIRQWVINHTGSVGLNSQDKLGFAISKDEGNAIDERADGLYVESSDAAVYKTDLADSTKSKYQVGGIPEGTTVAQLKGKAFSSIINDILFPSYTRDLIQPKLISILTNQLVEMNTVVLQLNPQFIQGDAGKMINLTQSITHNDQEFTNSIYNDLGEYLYTANAEYSAGEYLTNDRGELTNQRIEAGSVKLLVNITATYPWYYNNNKGQLVAFNTQSNELTIQLSGKATIKLPGVNSTIDSFKVDGGFGYLDVNLDGWDKSTEEINGYTYSVWTKQDAYVSTLSHKIQFTLK